MRRHEDAKHQVGLQDSRPFYLITELGLSVEDLTPRSVKIIDDELSELFKGARELHGMMSWRIGIWRELCW